MRVSVNGKPLLSKSSTGGSIPPTRALFAKSSPDKSSQAVPRAFYVKNYILKCGIINIENKIFIHSIYGQN